MDTSLIGQISQADMFFIASGFAGMVFHYMKKSLKNQTDATIFQWFGKDNAHATIATMGAFAMACVAALNSGIITPDMSLWAILYAGATTGFAIDSGFNNDSAPTKELIEK